MKNTIKRVLSLEPKVKVSSPLVGRLLTEMEIDSVSAAASHTQTGEGSSYDQGGGSYSQSCTGCSYRQGHDGPPGPP